MEEEEDREHETENDEVHDAGSVLRRAMHIKINGSFPCVYSSRLV